MRIILPHTPTNRYVDVTLDRQTLYARLLSATTQLQPNTHPLACMIASHYSAESVMPPRLGLSEANYKALLKQYFPYFNFPLPARTSGLDPSRALEAEDLRQLLLNHRATDAQDIDWIVQILVTGCLGQDHLWQDLGLWSRVDLSALITNNFPTLAAKNAQNMKWKKFFYKQLCLAEGIYICRAPSCEVCSDYNHCFNPDS